MAPVENQEYTNLIEYQLNSNYITNTMREC